MTEFKYEADCAKLKSDLKRNFPVQTQKRQDCLFPASRKSGNLYSDSAMTKIVGRKIH